MPARLRMESGLSKQFHGEIVIMRVREKQRREV
jgi:hypothetical protein